ncbi:MAG: (Fe-S)-binding protein [Betaproteobacteria bacterium]|nr:(Fe-S)-binding protein [Betaproteobacteria bacterium]NBT74856.1 (Fe-S)-binding protein [Betaproteobacteria bacterium]
MSFPQAARLLPTDRVALFVTCLVDLMRPEIGFAALKLLEHAGCQVVVPPDQTCCGQPAYNSGDRAAAHRLAERVLEQLEGFDYVVVPSGSCGGMIKVHYLELFSDDPSLRRRMSDLAPRVFELTQFLADVAHVRAVPGSAQGSITYHDSCSGLRELGVQAQPRALLSQIRGLELREMGDSRACCGFGGSFSLKYGEVSAAIGDEKIGQIHATGAQAVVLGDLGCMLHLEGRLRRLGDDATKVLHVAQVLAGELEDPS